MDTLTPNSIRSSIPCSLTTEIRRPSKYDEIVRRVNNKSQFRSGLIAESAKIIKRFIEDYLEKPEEDFLFPRFEKDGKHTDLVTVPSNAASRRPGNSECELNQVLGMPIVSVGAEIVFQTQSDIILSFDFSSGGKKEVVQLHKVE
jgi:hypothetical protein